MTEAMFAADTLHSTRPHYNFRHFDSHHAPQNRPVNPQFFDDLIDLKVKTMLYLCDTRFSIEAILIFGDFSSVQWEA